ncbi:NUDIX domain-containing protein [Paenibacillus sp. Z3-2]
MTNAVNNDISFEQNNNKFNFRVAGIVIDKGSVLLHTTEQDDFWKLPGGRMEMNERTEGPIVREMMEELEQMEVYPVFLKKELNNFLDAKGIKHFIQK